MGRYAHTLCFGIRGQNNKTLNYLHSGKEFQWHMLDFFHEIKKNIINCMLTLRISHFRPFFSSSVPMCFMPFSTWQRKRRARDPHILLLLCPADTAVGSPMGPFFLIKAEGLNGGKCCCCCCCSSCCCCHCCHSCSCSAAVVAATVAAVVNISAAVPAAVAPAAAAAAVVVILLLLLSLLL